VTPIHQSKSAGVPEHVRVSFEGKSCHVTCPLDHASEAGRRERRAAF
jgi:hypothetical protein